MQRLTNKLSPRALQLLDKLVWFVCTARNAIVVIACLVMAMLVDPAGHSCKVGGKMLALGPNLVYILGHNICRPTPTPACSP